MLVPNNEDILIYVTCAGCAEPMPSDECTPGAMFGVQGMLCEDCVTFKDEIGDIGDEVFTKPTTQGQTQTTNTFTSTAGKTTTNGALPSQTPLTSYTYAKCKHHLTPFKFDEYTVYLSGSLHSTATPEAEWPEAGVYLSTSWLNDQVASTDGTAMPASSWPSLFLGWPDRGAVSLDVLKASIKWAIGYMKKGKRLEIACAGGHGRTGTFVVALMIALGWSAFEAFTYLRDEYCDEAVESREQTELLVKWEKICKKN